MDIETVQEILAVEPTATTDVTTGTPEVGASTTVVEKPEETKPEATTITPEEKESRFVQSVTDKAIAAAKKAHQAEIDALNERIEKLAAKNEDAKYEDLDPSVVASLKEIAALGLEPERIRLQKMIDNEDISETEAQEKLGALIEKARDKSELKTTKQRLDDIDTTKKAEKAQADFGAMLGKHDIKSEDPMGRLILRCLEDNVKEMYDGVDINDPKSYMTLSEAKLEKALKLSIADAKEWAEQVKVGTTAPVAPVKKPAPTVETAGGQNQSTRTAPAPKKALTVAQEAERLARNIMAAK